jgi:hypothetical protein
VNRSERVGRRRRHAFEGFFTDALGGQFRLAYPEGLRGLRVGSVPSVGDIATTLQALRSVAGSAKVSPLPLGSPKPMRETLMVGRTAWIASVM